MVKRLSLSPQDAAAGLTVFKQYSVWETYPSHCHDYFEVFFIASGKGTHCIGSHRLLLEKGSLVLMRPDDVHSFSAFNYFDFTMYNVGFPVEEMQRALSYMDMPLSLALEPELPPHTVLHGQVRASLEQELAALLQRRPEQRLPKLRMLLPGVLDRLLTPTGSSGQLVLPPWLSRLDELMSRRENYVQGLPRMQELCPYSQAYMNRMFQRYMKLTPTEYINSKRMHYASELLLEKKYDIAEVCYLSGFNNLSYFYTVFRRHYHCAPGAFAARQRAEG